MKSHPELTNTTWSNVIDRSFSPRHICFTGPTSQTHPGADSSKYFCLFASQSRFQLLNLMIENNPHQSWLSESQQWGPSDYMISSSLLFSPQPPSAAATCSFKATTPPCTVCSLKQQDGGGEEVRRWGGEEVRIRDTEVMKWIQEQVYVVKSFYKCDVRQRLHWLPRRQV